MEPHMKWNKIILAWIFMRQLLQPITAFVYCNRQVAAVCRQQAKKTEISMRYQMPAQLNALNSTHGRSSAKIILFHFMLEPRVK